MDTATFKRKYTELLVASPLTNEEKALEAELDEFDKEWEKHEV